MLAAVSTSMVADLHNLFAPDSGDGAEWFESHENVVALLEWLEQRGEIAMEIGEIAYFLRKPWKWENSWAEMQRERRAAATAQDLHLIDAGEA